MSLKIGRAPKPRLLAVRGPYAPRTTSSPSHLNSPFVWGVRASRLESAYFVVARRPKARLLARSACSLRSLRLALVSRCLPHSLAGSLARPGQRRASLAQHGGARLPTLTPPLCGAFAHRAWNPPTSSSLADQKRICSLEVHCSLRSLRLALVSRCLPHSLAGSLARPGQRRASLAQHGGARLPTLTPRGIPRAMRAAPRNTIAQRVYFPAELSAGRGSGRAAENRASR